MFTNIKSQLKPRWVYQKFNSLPLALLLLFTTMYLQLENSKPYYNWDIIPYVAIALSYFEDDPVKVHRKTFQEIRTQVSDSKFKSLTQGRFRRSIYQRPIYLQEQFPFYSVKPAYPALIAVLTGLGVNPAEASVGISRVFFALDMLLIFYWLRLSSGNLFSALFTSIVFSIPQVTALASLSTPDAMGTFFNLFALYWILGKGKDIVGLFILMVAILVRPDAMLLLVLIAISLTIFKFQHIKTTAPFVAAALIVYLGLSQISGNYGWGTLLAHSFDPMLEPSKFQDTKGLVDYFGWYWNLFKFTMLNTLFPFYVLLIGVSCIISWRRTDFHKAAILGSIVLFMGAHWLAHPVEKERTLAFALILGLILIQEAVPRRKNRLEATSP